ncbi:hypothetical protein M0R45_019183 [Rubus argutus]|uniref:Uncharacterized protein n=1 Tax=Rubus argutus TaxID=59490 RepID=A0AAW1X6L3_RUBAR
MVNVGVILDLDTPVGKMAHHCVSMALSDFYARNANRTKLNLTVKDSRNDVVSASSAEPGLFSGGYQFVFMGDQAPVTRADVNAQNEQLTTMAT